VVGTGNWLKRNIRKFLGCKKVAVSWLWLLCDHKYSQTHWTRDGCSSEIEHLSTVCTAMSSIPSVTHTKVHSSIT
jgi:hypothetical protein